MHPAQKVWLPCKVSDGMFSGELAIEINAGGQNVSLFASSSLVKQQDGENYLSVTYLGDNGKAQHKTILLPSECFETGSRWLSVPEEALKENLQLAAA
jgi:hypothetical protein